MFFINRDEDVYDWQLHIKQCFWKQKTGPELLLGYGIPEPWYVY